MPSMAAEIEKQRKLVHAMVAQSQNNDPLALFHSYPAIEPQVNAFPASKPPRNRKVSASLSPLNVSVGNEIQMIEHVQGCGGVLKNHEHQLYSSKKTQAKQQMKAAPFIHTNAPKQLSPKINKTLMQTIPNNLPQVQSLQ